MSAALPSPPALPASLSRSAEAKAKPRNRKGMEARGIYPDVSRTKLAQELGVHTATVSNYLGGRRKMPLGQAQEAARAMGVGLDEFVSALIEVRQGWERERKESGRWKRSGRVIASRKRTRKR